MMRYLMLPCLGLMFLMISLPVIAGDMTSLISQAKEQINSQSYDAAEITLRRAFTIKKNHLQGRFLLARISELRGDYREAITRYKHLLFLKSKHIPALEGLAHSAEKLGKDELAKNTFIRAFRVEPDQWQWLFEVVRIDMKNHDYRKGAERRLRKLIKGQYRLDDSLRYIIKLYHAEGIKYKAKKYEKMLAIIRPAVSEKNEKRLVSQPAVDKQEAGNVQNSPDMERQFNQLILKTSDKPTSTRQAESYPVLDNFLYLQALKDWHSWKESGDVKLYQRALSNALMWENKVNRQSIQLATDSFLQAMALNTEHERAQFSLATSLFVQGKFEQAFEQWKSLLKNNSNLAVGIALSQFTMSAMVSGQAKEGGDLLRFFSKEHSGSAEIRINLAVLLKSQGKATAAREQLINILAKKIGSPQKRDYALAMLGKWNKETK